MWNSSASMMVFDVLIVSLSIFASFKCLQQFNSYGDKISGSQARERKSALSTIIVGLICVASFYLIDLLVMQILPFFMPMRDAMQIVKDWHLNYNWFVLLVAVGFISIGIVRLIGASSSNRQSSETVTKPIPHETRKVLLFIPAFSVLIIGIILSCVASIIIQKQHEAEINKRFQQVSGERIVLIQEHLIDSMKTVQPLKAFYSASQEVTREEFKIFAKNLILDHGDVQALEWIPLVTADKRQVFETAAKKIFPDFKIQGLKPDGVMGDMQEKDYYFPVYYVEPYRGNEAALGFDLSSHPERRVTLERSRDSGESRSSGPITLVQEKESIKAILVVAPIYQNGAAIESISERRAHLQGFVLSVHRIDAIVAEALNHLVQVPIAIRIEDVTTPSEGDLLYPDPFTEAENILSRGRDPELTELILEKHFFVAGSEWRILSMGFHRDFSGDFKWWEATVPIGIFVVTGLLASYLLLVIRQREEQGIAAGTLQAEIDERAKTETRLNLALEAAKGSIWDWNIVTGEVLLGPRWFSRLEYEPNELEPNIDTWKKLLHPDDRALVEKKLEALLQGETDVYECETRLRTKSGRYIWTIDRGKAIARDQEGKPLRMVGTNIDISKRKEDEEHLHFRAYYDALTELPNRTLAFERLSDTIMQGNRYQRKAALLFIDLDHFKQVNDTFGHIVGDEVLVMAAGRLCAAVRESDIVARTGGDEFLTILPEIITQEEVTLVAGKILDQMSLPFEVKGRDLFLGASIGITMIPEDGQEATILLKNADRAMYQAKSKGRNNYQFFNKKMEKIDKERTLLEWDLRQAIDNQELILHYQPIVDLRSLKTVSLEALIRWQHPRRGLVSPDEFIPLAEHSGLISQISQWVLLTACTQVKKWQDVYGLDTAIAVNLSSRDFQNGGLSESLVLALEQSGLPAESLILEITEGLMLDPNEEALNTLQTIKDVGIRLSIDDFGTGYSSLSYLSRYPLDFLKIDKSFIEAIHSDPQKKALVEAITRMGQIMGMKVIAEGVETYEELSYLMDLGCDKAQGFYFSKPLSVEDYEAVLEKR